MTKQNSVNLTVTQESHRQLHRELNIIQRKDIYRRMREVYYKGLEVAVKANQV